MAKIEILIPQILRWEGGYVNDPLDRGGATNKGITLKTYISYRKSKGLSASVNELQNISDSEWLEIFKTLYWDRWQADKIQNQAVANILVDWVWSSGISGIKIPQRILGVTADGKVGTQTLMAINNSNPKILFDRLKTARLKFIDTIIANKPTQKRFEKGWKNRINQLKYLIVILLSINFASCRATKNTVSKVATQSQTITSDLHQSADSVIKIRESSDHNIEAIYTKITLSCDTIPKPTSIECWQITSKQKEEITKDKISETAVSQRVTTNKDTRTDEKTQQKTEPAPTLLHTISSVLIAIIVFCLSCFLFRQLGKFIIKKLI